VGSAQQEKERLFVVVLGDEGRGNVNCEECMGAEETAVYGL
jgi:hypothetical protein